jgi:hypothetical protein
MKKHKILFICAIIQVFIYSYISAQHTISVSGTVKDTLGNPLEFVNIIVKPASEDKIIAYTITDAKGEYILSVYSSKVSVSASLIGYKTDIRYIDSLSSLTNHFILKEENSVLQEVIINEKRDVWISGDTISFRADAFKNNQERVAEDLLKKIPGIEVERSGSITYNGKSIKKILLEGDDLISENYTLLSKNLPAYTLDEVQILNNYSENTLFKGVENSEEIAINLKLKKKRLVFGNSEAGYGNENRYEAKLNLFSLFKKHKLYAIGSMNNTGIEPIGEVNFLSENQLSNSTHPRAESIIMPNEIQAPYFDGIQSNLNNVKFGAVNSIFNIKKKLQIKINSFLLYDKKKVLQSNSTKILPPDETINFNEIYNLSSNLLKLNADISAIWEINKNNQFKLITNYQKEDGSADNSLTINDNDVSNIFYENPKNTKINANYAHKLSRKSLIEADFIYIKSTQQQSLYTPLKYMQFYNENLDYKKFITRYIQRKGKFTTNHKFAFENKNNILKSMFLSETGTNPIIDNNNNLNYKYSKITYDLKIIYASKKVEFTNYASINSGKLILLYDSDLQENFTYINYQAILKYKPDDMNSFSIQIAKLYNEPSTSLLYPDFIQTSHRSFQKGRDSIIFTNSKKILLTYSYINYPKGLRFQIFSSLIHSSDAYNPDIDISQKFSLQSRTIGKGGDTFVFGMEVSKYLKFIKSNIKLKNNTNYILFFNQINGVEQRQNKSFSQEYNLSIRSSNIKKINFDTGININMYNYVSASKNGIQKNKNTFKSTYIYLYFDINERIRASLSDDFYIFNDRHFINFLNINFSYEVLKSSFFLHLKGNNLFGNNTIQFVNNSDYQLSSIAYQLLPPFLMLQTEFRF